MSWPRVDALEFGYAVRERERRTGEDTGEVTAIVYWRAGHLHCCRCRGSVCSHIRAVRARINPEYSP